MDKLTSIFPKSLFVIPPEKNAPDFQKACLSATLLATRIAIHVLFPMARRSLPHMGLDLTAGSLIGKIWNFKETDSSQIQTVSLGLLASSIASHTLLTGSSAIGISLLRLTLGTGTGFSLVQLQNSWNIDQRILEDRKICKSLPFDAIVTKYGLKNLFSKDLLSPEDFKIKYEAHAKNLFAQGGIQAVLIDYKKVHNQNLLFKKSYNIYPPSSFHTEWMTQSHLLQEIIPIINELIEYEVIQDLEYIAHLNHLIKRHDRLIQEYEMVHEFLNKQVQEIIDELNRHCEEKVQAINAEQQKIDVRKAEINQVEQELLSAQDKQDPETIKSLTKELSRLKNRQWILALAAKGDPNRKLALLEKVANKQYQGITNDARKKILYAQGVLIEEIQALEIEHKQVRELIKNKSDK